MDVMHTCQLAVDRPLGATAVVRVAGELTVSAAVRLEGLLDRVAAGGTGRVVVDLANVRWFAHAAVTDLDRTRRRLASSGTVLVLVGLDDRRSALPGDVGEALRAFVTLGDLERAAMGE